VVGDLGEGRATEVPGLIKVIEAGEAGALMADGEFGDVLGDAELGHQRAAGPAQVVGREVDARGAPYGVKPQGPAGDDTAGFLPGEDERVHGRRLRGDDGAHEPGERHLVLLTGLRVARGEHEAVGEDPVAGERGDLVAAGAGQQ